MRRGLAIVTAVGACTALAVTSASAGSAPDQTAQASAPKVVKMGDNFFSPAKAVIRAGGKVTWSNRGKVRHNAVGNSGAFNTGTFGPGQSRTVKFRRAGKFPYVCTLHTGMRGKVKVCPKAGC